MRQVRTPGLSSRFRESSIAFALTLIIFGTGLCDPVQARTIRFDPPGATDTYPMGINASRWITGWYKDSNSKYHAFLRATDGTITTIDVKGARCGTEANSINRSGVIVGVEFDSNCDFHGFVRAADGTITTFEVPGAIDTDAISVNNGGLVTGFYLDSRNHGHGFLRATDGTFTSFDAKGSIATGAASINKHEMASGRQQTNQPHRSQADQAACPCVMSRCSRRRTGSVAPIPTPRT